MPCMALGHRGFGCIFKSKYKVSSTPAPFNPSREGEWEEGSRGGGGSSLFLSCCSEQDGFGCVDKEQVWDLRNLPSFPPAIPLLFPLPDPRGHREVGPSIVLFPGRLLGGAQVLRGNPEPQHL